MHAANKAVAPSEIYYEIESLKISLDETLNGVITFGKIKCVITPETQASANHLPVSLTEATSRRGKFAVVVCDANTGRALEIQW